MQYPLSDPGSRLSGGKFTDGDPGTGVLSSVAKAAHWNAVYDELIAAITALGGAPTEGVNNQLAARLVAYIAAQVASGVSGVRGGVSAAYDTLQEIALELGNKSNIAHSHAWSAITGKPALSDAIDQGNSNQIATSAAVNSLRGATLLALAGKAGAISGTYSNFYIPDIPLRVKIGLASLTAAAGVGLHTGAVLFPQAFPTSCLAVIPILSSLEDISQDYYATLSCHAVNTAGFFWKLHKFTSNGAWSCTYIAVGT